MLADGLSSADKWSIGVAMFAVGVSVLSFAFSVYVWRRSIRTKLSVSIYVGKTGRPENRYEAIIIEGINRSGHIVTIDGVSLVWNKQPKELTGTTGLPVPVSPHDRWQFALSRHDLNRNELTLPARVQVILTTADRKPFKSRHRRLEWSHRTEST